MEEEVKVNVAEEAQEAVAQAAPVAEKETRKSSLNASVAPEDFDWDAFEQAENYGGTSKADVEAAYDQTLSKVVENEVVEGEVTSINKREVIVSIGGKSEGVISAPEFRYNPDLKAGDVVEVYVENAEDKKGQLVLSHKKARLSKSWDRVNAALEAQEVVNGYIKCRTKGGMIVDVFGIEAFLPGS
ncbi:MAG: S1 RNA-binding domain-containing protein, partial [Bacteroidales bacterium]|nr:S1 RNA-binding domain-containing protein [Bacteroidales bacterium]